MTVKIQNTLPAVPLRKSLGFIQNTSTFIADNYDNYGDFYALSLPAYHIHVVIDPDILGHILVKNEPNYVKSKIYWGELRKMVGDALGTLEGAEWLWLKRLQMQVFTQKYAETYLDEVLESNTQHFQKWVKAGGEIDIIAAFATLNTATLLKVLFGVEHSPLCDLIANHIADGEETIAWRSKFPWRPTAAWLNGMNHRYKKSLAFFDQLTDTAIKENKDKSALKKLINLLIDESNIIKTDGKLTKENIRNEIIIHLGAGTETAAVGMGWTIYLLQKHPEVLQKVRDEIDKITKGSPVSPEHHKKLIYTTWAIKEALRLYPPSHGIVRDALDKDQINGIEVKKGYTYFISAYGLHRNPRLWENPNEYIPERFENEKDFIKNSYIPFAVGKHSCIGKHLAMPMMVLSLAGFLQKFDFSMHIKEPISPISLSTLKPNQPLLTKLQLK